MALGLSLSRALLLAVALGLGASSCATRNSDTAAVSPPRGAERRAGPPQAAELTTAASLGSAGAERAEQFLVATAAGALLLRSSQSHAALTLAEHARRALHDPALDLLWFTDERGLWVIDLRVLESGAATPVLIASALPEHQELHIAGEGSDFLEPTDACDFGSILTLHWTRDPWLEGPDGQAQRGLAGSRWLKRERTRRRGPAGSERWFSAENAHADLPSSRLHCDAAERCGAALPFGDVTGRELVLTDQDEGGDCWSSRCLWHDRSTGKYATPPDASTWAAATEVASGTCGPYRFNHAGTAFLVGDRVCEVAGACRVLEGPGIGWLVPGLTTGAPG